MGLIMMMSGRVGKEWDDDQTKWDVGDGTSTTTRNNHQMVKKGWVPTIYKTGYHIYSWSAL